MSKTWLLSNRQVADLLNAGQDESEPPPVDFDALFPDDEPAAGWPPKPKGEKS